MTAKERDELVQQWIEGLSFSELRYALTQCAFALIDDEQLAYRHDDRMRQSVEDAESDDGSDEGLYWKTTGELIIEP